MNDAMAVHKRNYTRIKATFSVQTERPATIPWATHRVPVSQKRNSSCASSDSHWERAISNDKAVPSTLDYTTTRSKYCMRHTHVCHSADIWTGAQITLSSGTLYLIKQKTSHTQDANPFQKIVLKILNGSKIFWKNERRKTKRRECKALANLKHRNDTKVGVWSTWKWCWFSHALRIDVRYM